MDSTGLGNVCPVYGCIPVPGPLAEDVLNKDGIKDRGWWHGEHSMSSGNLTCFHQVIKSVVFHSSPDLPDTTTIMQKFSLYF